MAVKKPGTAGDRKKQANRSRDEIDDDEDEDLHPDDSDDDSDDDDDDQDDDDDLDEDDEDDQDDDDSDDEDEDDEDDDEDDRRKKRRSSRRSKPVTQDQLKALEQRLGDRLVNAVLKDLRGGDLRRRPAGGSSGRSGSRDDRRQQGGRTRQQVTKEEPVADVRAARSAFREALVDSDFRFNSPEERQVAIDMGKTAIAAAAVRGIDDEDEFGQQVADDVIEKIKKLRATTTRTVKRRLRQRGELPERRGQEGGGSAGAGGGSARRVGARSELKSGAELAQARHASRFPAKPGE